MGMKEITPKELRKLNDKSFKETQKYFRRRLRETATSGDKEVTYNPNNYACGDQIKPWLEGLGFTVKHTNPFWCRVTWPESLTEKEVILLTKPVAAKTYCHPKFCPNCGAKMHLEEDKHGT